MQREVPSPLQCCAKRNTGARSDLSRVDDSQMASSRWGVRCPTCGCNPRLTLFLRIRSLQVEPLGRKRYFARTSYSGLT
eukprot:5151068-Amphidinium_carterae.2